jgi:hypothetical protein
METDGALAIVIVVVMVGHTSKRDKSMGAGGCGGGGGMKCSSDVYLGGSRTSRRIRRGDVEASGYLPLCTSARLARRVALSQHGRH